MKKKIQTPSAPQPIGPYSQAIIAGPFLYVSGQIGMDLAGNMKNETLAMETHQVLANIESILKEAIYDFSNVVKTSIFLMDMNDFQEVNSIYATYFTEPFPARETIQVSRLPKDARLEISIVAYK